MNNKEFENNQETLNQELEKRLESNDLPDANIMLAGKTGTGKSTLLNAIFGKNLAETGTGRPVTDHIDEYKNEDIPIRIWDTVGLELDSEKTRQSIEDIKRTIAKQVTNQNMFDRMHAIWYCITAGSNRYEGAEVEFIEELHSVGVPFIIVLTQCYGSSKKIDEFVKIINEINTSRDMKDIKVVRVLAQEYEFEIEDKIITKKPFGLDDLVKTTTDSLPKYIKTSFAAAQRVSQFEKRQECIRIIYDYADASERGFFDKIPLLNILTTNSKIKSMFNKLAKVYNIVIPLDKMEPLYEEFDGLSFTDKLSLLTPFKADFDREVKEKLRKIDKKFEDKYKDLTYNHKTTNMIILYGCTFIDASEEVWNRYTEEQLSDVDFVIRELSARIRSRLAKRKSGSR